MSSSLRVLLFSIVLFFFFFSPFVTALCLPEAREVDPSKPEIIYGYGDWLGADVDRAVLTILIEELYGHKVIPKVVTFADLPMVTTRELDMYIEYWDSQRQEVQEILSHPNVGFFGTMGLRGRIGWFMPTYLLDYDPDLENWGALRKSGYSKLFASDFSGNLTSDSNQVKRLEELTALLHTLDPMSAEYEETFELVNEAVAGLKVVALNNSDPSVQGVVWAPDPSAQWGNIDQDIINKYNINFKLDYFGFPYEDSMIENMRNLTDQKKPFLSYMFTPHFGMDPRSNLNLTRLQFQEWDDSCSFDTTLRQCINPDDPLIKVLGTSLREKSGLIFSLGMNFRFRSNQDQIKMMGDIKYAGMTAEETACNWILDNYEFVQSLLPQPKPLVYLPYQGTAGIVLTVLASLFALLTLVIAGIVHFYRESPVIMAASRQFCLAILLGGGIGYAAMFMFLGAPTPAICTLRPILMTLSFSIMYAHLLVKNYRIWRIFKHPVKNSHSPISDRTLALFAFGIIAIEILILVIWLAWDAPMPLQLETETIISWSCSSANATVERVFTWLLVSLNIVLITFGAFLALETRQVNSKFRESRYIGFSIYNTIIVGIIVIAFAVIPDIASFETKMIILCLGIVLIPSFTVFFLFVPKIVYLLFPQTIPSYDTEEKRNSSAGRPASQHLSGNGTSKVQDHSDRKHRKEPRRDFKFGFNIVPMGKIAKRPEEEPEARQGGEVDEELRRANSSELMDIALERMRAGDYEEAF